MGRDVSQVEQIERIEFPEVQGRRTPGTCTTMSTTKSSGGCDENESDTYPAGSGGGGWFSPVRSRRFAVLAAALPTVANPPALQASRWSCGILSVFCSSSGASTKVAIRPETTCHSIWQWKSQTPVEMVGFPVLVS